MAQKAWLRDTLNTGITVSANPRGNFYFQQCQRRGKNALVLDTRSIRRVTRTEPEKPVPGGQCRTAPSRPSESSSPRLPGRFSARRTRRQGRRILQQPAGVIYAHSVKNHSLLSAALPANLPQRKERLRWTNRLKAAHIQGVPHPRWSTASEAPAFAAQTTGSTPPACCQETPVPDPNKSDVRGEQSSIWRQQSCQ
ncbi:hypothetical protein GN956_G21620 [Arapaima gigas]